PPALIREGTGAIIGVCSTVSTVPCVGAWGWCSSAAVRSSRPDRSSARSGRSCSFFLLSPAAVPSAGVSPLSGRGRARPDEPVQLGEVDERPPARLVQLEAPRLD